MSDRTLNRLIVGAIVAIVVIVPLIGVIYFFDRNTDPGPSMAQRAVTAAEEAVRQDPNNVSARIGLAAGYVADGRLSDAVTQFSEVLKVVPDHHGALLGRGNAYLQLKDDADAQKDFQRLVDVAMNGDSANADPQLEEAFYRLGDIYLRSGQYDQAVKSLQNALAINRTDADAMNLLGAAYVKTGKTTDAVTVLKEAISFVPTGWCDPYQHLADAYTAMGNADGVVYANAMVAFCDKQPDVAVKALTPLTSGAFALDATLGLAMIAEQQGDVATATTMYMKVLATDPKNFVAIAGMQRLGTAPTPSPSSAAAPAASPSTGANP